MNTMFQQILDPMSASAAGNEYVASAIRSLIGGPQFADVDDTALRTSRLAELYAEMQAAKIRFDGVVAKAWAKANEQFATAVEKRRAQSDSPLQPVDVLRVWLDLADSALTHAQRGTEYLEAQSAVLRSSMEFVLAQRELGERMFDSIGAPTRSELDEVHRSVQELKRRVRALERKQSDGAKRGAQP
ncbi:poly(R)-hydroxyalkanoic acid synthase subunit PhaE [Tsukamurella soli]